MSEILREATAADITTYRIAEQSIDQWEALRNHTGFDTSKNPNLRIFVANFDGTGNDAMVHPEKASNVARFHSDIESLNARGHNAIRAHYVEGPGTQRGRYEETIDQATGRTGPARLDAMYAALCEQTARWKAENPDAEIRVMTTGFSRGAVEAAAFTNLVERRGIRNPQEASIQNVVEPVQSSRNWIFNEKENARRFDGAPIVAAGKVEQAALLFDPVKTGVEDKLDTELAPSVRFALQINAIDEHRTQFPVNAVIGPETSGDGSRLRLWVSGAHSDIGGGYEDHQGLARMSGNVAAMYLDRLTGSHNVFRQVEVDPRECAVHDSNGRMFKTLGFLTGNGTSTVRNEEEGAGIVERTQPTGKGIRLPAEQVLSGESQEFPRFAERTAIPEPRLTEVERDALRPQTKYVQPDPVTPATRSPDGLLTQALTAVGRLSGSTAFNDHLPPGVEGENRYARLAGAVALQAYRDRLERIDEVVLNTDGTRLIAIQGNHGHPELSMRSAVRIDEALATPASQSIDTLRHAANHQEALRAEPEARMLQEPESPMMRRQ